MDGLIAGIGGTVWTLAAFIIALSIIVTVHEFGHYIVGRWSGIKAEVFSVGFGPRLFSRRDRHGTLWQVAALPLGGYVRFKGDTNAASTGPGRAVAAGERRQTLSGAPLWARAATLIAGPFFNFNLSTLIFAGFAVFVGLAVDEPRIGALEPAPPGIVNELRPGDTVLAVDGQPVASWADLANLSDRLPLAAVHDWRVRRGGDEITVPGPDPMPARITGISPRSAASDAGLRAGDVILAVDNQPVTRFSELPAKVAASQGAPVVLRVWRHGAGEADYALAARERDMPLPDGGFEKRWLIGVSGGASYFTPATRSAGLAEALGLGLAQTWGVVDSSITGIWAMVTGQISSCNLGGAISIAESTGEAASAGGGNFLWWVAILSAAIGFLNLLPIPVLDGGHLAFYAWEAVTGRAPSERVMGFLTTAGLAAVLTLMIFGLSNDLLCR